MGVVSVLKLILPSPRHPCAFDVWLTGSVYFSCAGKCLGCHPIREVVWFPLLGGGYTASQQGRGLRDGQSGHEWAPLCAGQQRGLCWKSPAAGYEWGPFCAPTRLLLALAGTTDTRPPVECPVYPPRALGSVNDPPVSCLATGATRHCIITNETNELFSGKPCQEFNSIPQTWVHELHACHKCFNKRLEACSDYGLYTKNIWYSPGFTWGSATSNNSGRTNKSKCNSRGSFISLTGSWLSLKHQFKQQFKSETFLLLGKTHN